MTARQWVGLGVLLLSLGGAWTISRLDRSEPPAKLVVIEPVGIMGTVSTLAVMTDQNESKAAAQLADAEARLRHLEALLSTWIDSSQLSRFNASPGAEEVSLAPEVLEVLGQARFVYQASDRAFDVTARPLIELWRRAERKNQLPSPEEVETARSASSWEQIELGPAAATKTRDSTRVDVDGIAKGFAIDRAVEVLEASGNPGGMVDVGGDLRVFGLGPHDGRWRVAVRSPFDASAWAELDIRSAAVCSSGDYARFLEIEDRRFSHILDPRTGRPADRTHAVTVVGPQAALADAWATALSILGVEGLQRLPAEGNLEAMVVTGEPRAFEVHATPGFADLLVRSDFTLTEVLPDDS